MERRWQMAQWCFAPGAGHSNRREQVFNTPERGAMECLTGLIQSQARNLVS